MRTRGGAILWVAGVLGYLILEAVTAAGYRPTYSYADNYISDLGVGNPRAHLMHAAFFLQGTMFLLGALFIAGLPRRGNALFLALSAANAVGNILVGVMHSGKVHVAGAALAIMGGNAAILAGCAVIGPLRKRYRRTSKIIAAVGFSCLFGLLIGWTSTPSLLPIGVWERGSVYSIFAWQVLTALTCR